jgi:phospholipid/cholesterol/gamma-HCH transport system substrate-binding protein
MKSGLIAGIFVVSALTLFTAGLFMIGNSHNLFNHHIDFYTELFNVNGLSKGMKVRVAGYSAGQVLLIELPDRPSAKFRLKLQVDDKLRPLVRNDSVVTVESDGLVGDKFLLIHDGTDQSPEAQASATLPSREPVELSAVIAKATGVMDQAHELIGDLQTRLDVALSGVTKTVGHADQLVGHADGLIGDADGLIGDARNGKGTVGMLLNDPQTADRLRATVVNAEQASVNVKQITVQAGQVLTDFQSRNLPAKADETMISARHAAQQIDEASQQVNTTLKSALGPDHSGENAAENIRESLSNANVATANLADDTEALKHEFFFRGFFKKRGFYSLGDLTAKQYRGSSFFQSPKNHRSWFEANDSFAKDPQGVEVLSAGGMRLIDAAVDSRKDTIFHEPVIVEGYSAGEDNRVSQSRAVLVKLYLQKHFHLRGADIGLITLGSTPPQASGKGVWNGACLVFLASPK